MKVRVLSRFKPKEIHMLRFILLFFFIFESGIYSWELSKEREGVRVFTRTVEGSNFKEFKAVGMHNGTISSIVGVLQDEAQFCKWFPDCKEFRIIKRLSSLERLQYMVIKAPFPVNNRDTIQRSKLNQDPISKAVTINIEAQPEELAPVDGVVRIPKSRGFWKIIPSDKGKVEITFQLHSDPGGTLPEWVANLFVTETPLKALIQLSKLAGSEKYKNINLDYISEP